MHSKIIIERSGTTYNQSFGLSDLTDVYANTVSGDTVIVYGGTYALAADGIQLKDGVNWQFIGNPTISSDAVAGTFYDNNVSVDCQFQGNVVITNSNGLASRIILQNASSTLNGFCWEYKAIILQDLTDVPSVVASIINTLGDVPVWTRSTTGTYPLTLTGAFSANNTEISISHNDYVIVGAFRIINADNRQNDYLTFYCGDVDGALADNFYATINIKVYP